MYLVNIEFEDPKRNDEVYEIIYWSGKSFDFSFPFRAVLEKITNVLNEALKGMKVGCVDFPEYSDYEDFISFRLQIGEEHISGYFEQSLGYLSFSHVDPKILELLKMHCNGISFENEGYGVKEI